MALQDLCIDIIVSNFERYSSHYFNSEDEVLKRRFEFLQRKFSYVMASSLYEKNSKETKYIIDFFVNKYLRELDFVWLVKCSWDTIVAKIQEVGPALQSLSIMDGHGNRLQDLMCYLRNLRAIAHPLYCRDKFLISLAKFCPNLLEIDIINSDVTTEGIKRLCTKEDGESTGLKLKKICLHFCEDIHDDAIVYLIEHMPTLEIIDYSRLPRVLYSMHKKDLLQINKVKPYNLKKLNLLRHHPDFPDLQKICSSLCPRVKYLSCPIREQEDLKFVDTFCELEKLHLKNDSGLRVEIDELLESRGKKIRHLRLNSVSVSVSALANYCPALQYLRLDNVDLSSDNMSSVEFPRLERCILNGFSSESARALFRSSPILECVAFYKCDFSSEKMQAVVFSCCKKNPIRRIDFLFSIVEKPFILSILKLCHSLKYLYLKRLTDSSNIDRSDEINLVKIALSLPNRPEVVFDHCRSDHNDFITSRDIDFGDYYNFTLNREEESSIV